MVMEKSKSILVMMNQLKWLIQLKIMIGFQIQIQLHRKKFGYQKGWSESGNSSGIDVEDEIPEKAFHCLISDIPF